VTALYAPDFFEIVSRHYERGSGDGKGGGIVSRCTYEFSWVSFGECTRHKTRPADEPLKPARIRYVSPCLSTRAYLPLNFYRWSAQQHAARSRDMDGDSGEGITPNQLYARIMSLKPKELSFTVGVRQYLMQYFRAAATEDGHAGAGHGAIAVRLPLTGDRRAA
jgi:hypothetical protein